MSVVSSLYGKVASFRDREKIIRYLFQKLASTKRSRGFLLKFDAIPLEIIDLKTYLCDITKRYNYG